MQQSTIASLKTGDNFIGFLLVRSSDQRRGKNSAYLDINLVDKTGEINCKMWDGTRQPPKVGSIIKVDGRVQEFNGRLQMRINRMRDLSVERHPDDIVDLGDLMPCAPETPENMMNIINQTIDRFESQDLRKLTRELIRLAGDDLNWFPAAQKIHHAERSGLLHHTTSMLNTAEHIIASYPFLNGDLLRSGVIIHDLSKIDEMKSDEMGNVSDYTRDGLLIGHLVRGVTRIHEAAKNVNVSGQIVLLLEHMVISHHGVPEYGSPRQPMFPEAEALHWIDTLDARMNEMQSVMDRVPAGAFSEKIWSLDRRLYHPFYTDDAE